MTVKTPTNRMPCDDCHVDTDWHGRHGIGEYYMVSQRTWTAATGGTPTRYLCIGCLEGRLGRKVNATDFLFCPLNNDPRYYRSRRLVSRMSAVPD